MKRIILTLGLLAFMLLWAGKAKANWLGLASGDYYITLNSSQGICGGVNCTGTVHVGVSGSLGFDWFFPISFPPVVLDSPTSETLASSLESSTDFADYSLAGEVSRLNLGMTYDPATPSSYWSVVIDYCLEPGTTTCGHQQLIYGDDWSATAYSTPVPEPSSLALLGFGLAFLAASRRRKQ